MVKVFIILLTLGLGPSIVNATDSTSSSFIVRDPVVADAGGSGTSTSFELIQTLGEPGTGESSSTNFILRSGFLYFAAPSAASTPDPTPSASVSSGGSPGVAAYNPPTPPDGGFRIVINNGAATSTSTDIVITLYGGRDTAYALVSEDADFSDAVQIWYNPNFERASTFYKLDSSAGEKTLFARFYTRLGTPTADSYTSSIELVAEKNSSFFERAAAKVWPLVPNFLKPKPKSQDGEIIIPGKTPQELSGEGGEVDKSQKNAELQPDSRVSLDVAKLLVLAALILLLFYFHLVISRRRL